MKRNPRRRTTSSPIGVKPLTVEQIAVKYSDRKRVGKTERDKAKVKE